MAALFVIPRNWKQPRCLPAVHSHSGILHTNKNDEPLIHTSTGMNLLGITVKEKSHTQKTSFFMIQFV